MVRFVLIAAVGATLVAGAVLGDRARRQTQEVDVRGIAMLRVTLDSVRALYAVAPTAADSARLKQQVDERAYGVDRRQFHVPLRQETIDGWWTTSGAGSWLVVAGVVLIITGLFLARRTARS